MGPGFRRDDNGLLTSIGRPNQRKRTTLLRQQHIGPVPIRRRLVLLVTLDARLVEIEEVAERMNLVALAATRDRLQRALPVAGAVAGEHLDGEIAQALEILGVRHILAPADRIYHLGLLLALHHDEVELKDRELVLRGQRRA